MTFSYGDKVLTENMYHFF